MIIVEATRSKGSTASSTTDSPIFFQARAVSASDSTYGSPLLYSVWEDKFGTYMPTSDRELILSEFGRYVGRGRIS